MASMALYKLAAILEWKNRHGGTGPTGFELTAEAASKRMQQKSAIAVEWPYGPPARHRARSRGPGRRGKNCARFPLAYIDGSELPRTMIMMTIFFRLAMRNA